MNPSLPKVCIVGICLGKGGAERSVAILSQMLEDKAYDVHVAILTNKVDYPYGGKLYNLGVHKEKANTFIDRLLRFRKFRKYLKEQQIDIVIDQRPKNNYFRELFYAHYLYRGIKRIYVVQNSKLSTYFANPVSKTLKIYRNNLHTVGVSKYIYKNLLLQQGIKNSSCIHNTFEKDLTKNYASLPDEIRGLNNFILYFGRIDNRHKDLLFLLNSYEKSNLWQKNIPLVIVGDGPDKEMIMKHAQRLLCAKYLIFLGFTKHPFAIVQKARAVALTSNHEGFPLVLVESLAVGTPVVSLDFVSGPSEVIKNRENGLLVSNRDENEFAKALEEICLDELLYNTCKENAKASVQAFSTEEASKKWDTLLRKLTEHGV